MSGAIRNLLLVLVLAGLISHVLLCLALRKPVTSAWGLLAPMTLGLFIESYEIWVHYRDIGLFAAENDPLYAILLRHALDIIKMLALPFLIVIVGKTFVR